MNSTLPDFTPQIPMQQVRLWAARILLSGGAFRDLAQISGGLVCLLISKVCSVGFLLLLKHMADAERAADDITALAVQLTIWLAVLKLLEGLFLSLKELILAAPILRGIGRGVHAAHWAALMQPLSAHLQTGPARISQIIGRGARELYLYYIAVLSNFLPLMIDIIVACWLISTVLSVREGGVMLFFIAAYVLATFKLLAWRMPLRREMEAADLNREALAADTYTNIHVVKSFGRVARELSLFGKAMDRYSQAGFRSQASLTLVLATQVALFSVTLLAVILSVKMGGGTLTVGTAILTVTLILQLFVPLSGIGGMYRELQHCELSVRPLASLATLASAEDAQMPKATAGAAAVKLDSVTVWAGGKELLKNVNLEIAPGAKVALVGASGSGKSTLLRVVCGLEPYAEGEIRIAGAAMPAMSTGNYPLTAYVPQEPTLFKRSMQRNLMLEDQIESTRTAHAMFAEIGVDEAVRSRDPDSDEFGAAFASASGGEKQRFALLRGLLHPVGLVAFDEPSSALDRQTESRVFDLLLRHVHATMLVATHRIEYCSAFDFVVFMKDGRVAATGAHHALLDGCPEYRDFISTSHVSAARVRPEVEGTVG